MRTRSFMLHLLLGRGLVSCLPTVRGYGPRYTYVPVPTSEHEDSLIVTVELKCEAERADAVRARMEEGFVREAARGVSKGARPDGLRFGRIPRNFKGAVLAKELAAACAEDFPRHTE